MKEKSQIEDIDRSVYDIRDEEHDAYRMEMCIRDRVTPVNSIRELSPFKMLMG